MFKQLLRGFFSKLLFGAQSAVSNLAQARILDMVIRSVYFYVLYDY